MKTEELEDYWKSQDCIKPRKRELKEVYKTNNINKRNKRTKPIKNILERRNEHKEKYTNAEKKFNDIFTNTIKNVNLYSQFPIIWHTGYNAIKNKTFYLTYYVDFIDIDNKYIFEIDGGYHEEEKQKKKDDKRDKVLKEMGYKVIRYTNDEILCNPNEIKKKLINIYINH